LSTADRQLHSCKRRGSATPIGPRPRGSAGSRPALHEGGRPPRRDGSAVSRPPRARTGTTMNAAEPLLAAFMTPGLVWPGRGHGGAHSHPHPGPATLQAHPLGGNGFPHRRRAPNRRRIRMEEWILLALRCLAVFAVGLLVARPFVDPKGLAAALGGLKRTERVFSARRLLQHGLRITDGYVPGQGKTRSAASSKPSSGNTGRHSDHCRMSAPAAPLKPVCIWMRPGQPSCSPDRRPVAHRAGHRPDRGLPGRGPGGAA